jgi:hypothetical protein
MSDEYDEAEVQQVVVYRQPGWRWSWYDAAGIAVSVVGGFFNVLSQGASLLSQELAAKARWDRDRLDAAAAQAAYEREMERQAEALERQLGMDDYWTNGTPEDRE